MENRRFNQIKKKIAANYSKNKLHHFSEKIFWVYGAL